MFLLKLMFQMLLHSLMHVITYKFNSNKKIEYLNYPIYSKLSALYWSQIKLNNINKKM